MARSRSCLWRSNVDEYRFRDGFRARTVTAVQAHTELERLRADGPLTSSAVFDAARPKDAVLHGEFQWDGKKAVEELGLIRARTLIRAVVVLKPDQPPTSEYIHVPAVKLAQTEGRYEPLSVVVEQP